MQIEGRPTRFRWYTERSPGDGPRYEAAPGACRVAAPIDIEPAPGQSRVTPDTIWTGFDDFLGHQRVVTVDVNSGSGPVPVRYIERKTPWVFPTPGKLVGRPLYCSALTQGAGIGVAREGPEGTEYELYRMNLLAETRPYFVRPDDEVPAGVGSPLLDVTTLKGFPDEGYWIKNLGIYRSRYVTRLGRSRSSILELTGGTMKYQAEAGPPAYPAVGFKFAIPMEEGSVDLIYTWWLIPYPDGVPFKAIGKTLGRVNTNDFDGFTSGTLLLKGAEHTEPQPGPLGDLLVNVRYTVSWKPRYTAAGVALGHNAIFDPYFKKEYRLVDTVGDGTGRRPHLTAAFDALFRPDAP